MKTTDLNQEKIKEILVHAIAGLALDTVKDNYGYYTDIYQVDGKANAYEPTAYNEFMVAKTIHLYPELYPLMEEIVDKIAVAIKTNKVYAMWADDENPAGVVLAYALAMQDKKYCATYAKNLLSHDIDHTDARSQEIQALLEKWGPCEEIRLVLDARLSNAGEWGYEVVAEILEKAMKEENEALVELIRKIALTQKECDMVIDETLLELLGELDD
ncbi:MAG: hypothetical protein ACRCWR_07180 [Saezia sp.]